MDYTVAADPRFVADVGVRRIDKGHACFQHQAPNCAAAQKVFELGQIRARIDAGDFAGVVVLVQSNLFLSVSQDSRHIGQVIFAFAISFASAFVKPIIPAFDDE